MTGLLVVATVNEAFGNGGGGAAFSPSDIAGLSLWMRADDISGNDGDEISAWVSREGNSYSFEQTLTKRPLLKKGANGINSQNIVRFDGVNDLLVYTGNLLSSSEGTVLIVYRLSASPTATQELFSSADTALSTKYWTLEGYRSGATKLAIIQRSADTEDRIRGSTALSVNTAYIALFKSNGTAFSLRLNGAAETLAVESGANNGDWLAETADRDNFVIGGLKLTSESSFLKGDIAEILMYDTGLSAASISLLETYLDGRYAINP